jgi:hypothetical protein
MANLITVVPSKIGVIDESNPVFDSVLTGFVVMILLLCSGDKFTSLL